MQALYLNVGAHIRFRDGAGGTLHKLVVDPHTKQVTDLVILRGFLQKHDYVIPISTVDETASDTIDLNLEVADLARYPRYRELEFQEPLDNWEEEMTNPREHQLYWYPMVGVVERDRQVVPMVRRRVPTGIPTGENVIGRDSVVHNIDGVVGKVDHLWIDRNTWEITHLVVHRGITQQYVLIPFSWVSTIAPEEIFVHGTDAQLKQISPTQLRLAWLTEEEAAAEEAPLDASLVVADEIAAALAADERTADAPIDVQFERGVATLIGYVTSYTAHAAAEEIAAGHPRVVSVVSALEVHSKASAILPVVTALGTQPM